MATNNTQETFWDVGEYLKNLIDSPQKARLVKKVLDSTDITTLSSEDRQGYNLARQALTRWVNPMPKSPDADVYTYPREAGDVINSQMSRDTVTEATPDDFRTSDPSFGEHVGAGIKGLVDMVVGAANIPTTGDEWKQALRPSELLLRGVTGPLHPLVQQGRISKQKADAGVSLDASDIPIAGPMIVDPVKKLSRPSRAVFGENRPPTREESLEATRSGTALATTLALTPKSVRYAEAGGFNPILDPKRTAARNIARAETQVPKLTDKVRRRHDPKYAGRAHEAADVADALAADVRPTALAQTGSQARARTAVRMSDAAVGTGKAALKMAKSERVFEHNAPNKINKRLDKVLDDLPNRLARGDNPGAEALRPDRYRRTGLPRNPEMIKADKLKVHEETQARLQQPDMQSIAVPEDVTINYVMRDSLKKAHALVGDNPKSNLHLRDIVERTNRTGQLTVEDYNVLRDMTDGNYITGYTKTGEPIMQPIEMPQMLSDSIGYIERLRRENGGKLPSTPHELNQAKANRYDEVPDNTFADELTDADKAMHTVRRSQAMGLRRLVDEITAGPDGRSQITELNRSYANLAALESGVRNYNLATDIAPPQAPAIMGGGVSASPRGLLRLATGTSATAAITRPSFGMLASPQVGRRIALATETLGRMRGLKPPPKRPGAQPPPPGGNIPTGPTGPVNPRPSGAGPGPSAPRGPATIAPGVTPPAPAATPTPTKQPKTATATTPSAPSAPPPPAGTPGQTPLAKQVFVHARKGQFKQLKEIWSKHSAQLRKEMRPSDVKWVEDKLRRYEKNKATKATRPPKTSKPAEQKSAKTTGASAYKPADVTGSPEMASARADVAKAIASMESAGVPVPDHLRRFAQVDEPPVKSPSAQSASAPTRPPKPTQSTPDLTDQLGTDRIKGDWRQVKTLAETRPKPSAPVSPERPSGAVATEDWYFDDLPLKTVDRKITELTAVHANAIKRGNKALADRTSAMLADAQRVRTDRLAGKRPVKRPNADVEAILRDTDAELAAAEAEADVPESIVDAAAAHVAKKRLRIQALMDKAAKLTKSGTETDMAAADALLDEATKLADEL